MESTRCDGLVAGAIPREIHFRMFASKLYLCMYKNNLIQKNPGMFLHFLFIPSILHVNEYTRTCYLKLQRVEKRLSLKLILKAWTVQCIMVTPSGEGVILHGVSTCLVTGFVPDCLLKDVCLYSIYPWKVEIVSSSRAESRFVSWTRE